MKIWFFSYYRNKR